MVRLNTVAFENIGINRPLREELDARQLACLFLEHTDELGADDFTLGLGVGYAGQLVKEPVGRVDVYKIRVHLVAEDLDHLLGLALAQQPVIDMHADEPLPDGFDQQRRDDRRVHPAGQRQQHLFIPNLFAKLPHLFVNKCICQCLRRDARHIFRPFVIFHALHPALLRLIRSGRPYGRRSTFY